MSNKNKDIQDNDDYPENNLKDIKDNDNYPENYQNDIQDNDNYPENYQNDIQDNDNYPENDQNDIQDNDAFPENHLHDIQDNDAYPENHGEDDFVYYNANDNMNNNMNNDMNPNMINKVNNMNNDMNQNINNNMNQNMNNDMNPNMSNDMNQNINDNMNQNMNNDMNPNMSNKINNMDNDINPNINNDMNPNMSNKMNNNNFNQNMNNEPPQNQFNDDEGFYGENPYELKKQSDYNLDTDNFKMNNNLNKNVNKEDEEIYDDVVDDFNQFIDNQSNSEQDINENNNQINSDKNVNEKSFNSKSKKESSNQNLGNNQLIGDNMPEKEEETEEYNFGNEINNDIIGSDVHDNNLQNNKANDDIIGSGVHDNIIPGKEGNMNNNDIIGNNAVNYKLPNSNNNIVKSKQSEENFSLDLSSKNQNLPMEYQDNNNLNKQNINQSNNPQESNNSSQKNNNFNKLESGEIDLKNLKHEEDIDIESSSHNNNQNKLDGNNNQNNLNDDNNDNNNQINLNEQEEQKDSDKEEEIDEITEELYIEEYNPSLGLSKIENPKYLNAVIQCFAHIPDITDKIINLHLDQFFKNNLSNLKLTKKYRSLLINAFFPEKVYNMNRQAYNPSKFVNTLYELNPLFQNNENIELKEFINYLILKLHDELNIKKNSNSNVSDPNLNTNDNIHNSMQVKNESDALVNFLQNFTTKNNSLISKSLYGISKYTFYCHQCQNSFYNFQCYSYLYFNLSKVVEYKQSRHHREDVEITLNDCLDFYQKSETLIGDKGLFCPSCKQQTESTSIKNIYSTKNEIIFILDRNIGNDFNQKNVTFKETLNLRDYVQYKKEGEKSKEKFFLGGLVNYVGDNYGNETYNAFVKMGKNNDWYCYDDENVYPVSFEDIKNNGYPVVLFYHKLQTPK